MNRTITLIRHGKTAGNAEKRYIGVTDEPLCEEGIKELELRCYPKADIIFSSPLCRCTNTASLIYPNQDIQIISELRETDFGIFEGKNHIELTGVKEYEDWLETGGLGAIPNGENQEEAIKRTLIGFDKLLKASENAKNIAAVVHGGSIMAILSTLFEDDYYSYYVENGEGYTFDLSSDGVYSGLCARSFIR